MRLLSSVQPKNSKPNLKRLARAGDVDGLRRALSYREVIADDTGVWLDLAAPMRTEAVAVLAGLPEANAQEAIIDALRDESPEVRLAALRATRDFENERAVDALARGLAAAPARGQQTEAGAPRRFVEASEAWRTEALAAVVALDDPAALERVVAYMVQRAGEQPLRNEDFDVVRAVQRTPRVAGALSETAERLAEWLRHENHVVVRRTAQLLMAFGEEGLAALLGALRDQQRRVPAIRAIGELRDRSVGSSLLEYADDSDPSVRREVMDALGNIRDPTSVRALLNGANDPVYDVRAAACTALDSLGTAAVIVAFTSVVGPALERIADTAELNAELPRAQRTGAEDERRPLPEIPRTAGDWGNDTQPGSAPPSRPAPNGSSHGRDRDSSGIRRIIDAIVSGRTGARERRRPSGPE